MVVSPLDLPPDPLVHQAAVTVSDLRDPTSVGQSIAVLNQDVVKLSTSALRGRRIVQISVNYAILHFSERIHVSELCEAAGVSERTLQYAFKELLGMSPTAYLNQLRLHRVRQILRSADYVSTTVSKEATRCGFWHFGDFSRAYKECFGESPSDTLRRQP